MKLIRNNIIPFGDYAAINLFGFIFYKRHISPNQILLNHEFIHTLQMREMLYLPFYVVYVIEWLILIIKYKGNIRKAYYNISFEKEAYDNETDLSYKFKRKHYNQWKKKN